MADEKKEADSSGSSNTGGSKLGLILGVVNLLVTLGIGAVVFISFKKESSHPKVGDMDVNAADVPEGVQLDVRGIPIIKKKEAVFGKMVPLEQFVVNLSTPGSEKSRFFRAQISLEVPNDDIEQEVKDRMPQVRNTIIDLINSKRASDLVTPEGRDFLKEEIKNAINSFLVSGKLRGVHFTNFAVTS